VVNHGERSSSHEGLLVVFRRNPHADDVVVALAGLGVLGIGPRAAEEDERLPADLVHRPVGVLIPHGHMGHAPRQFVHVLDPGLAPTWRHAGRLRVRVRVEPRPSTHESVGEPRRCAIVGRAGRSTTALLGLCLPHQKRPVRRGLTRRVVEPAISDASHRDYWTSFSDGLRAVFGVLTGCPPAAPIESGQSVLATIIGRRRQR
jgi:hypothetical protein